MVFWGAFVAGFVACQVFGIGPVLKRAGGNWLAPPMIAGVVLGVAILALAVAFAARVRPAALPSDGAMVIALLVLIGAKVLVAVTQVAAVKLVRG